MTEVLPPGQPRVRLRRGNGRTAPAKPEPDAGAGHALLVLLEDTVPALLCMLEGTDVEELHVNVDTLRVAIRRVPAPAPGPSGQGPGIRGQGPGARDQAQRAGARRSEAEPAASHSALRTPHAALALPAGVAEVTAPVVGVFQAGKQPGTPPLVQAGNQVERGQMIGYVESMGLPNGVEAPLAGRLVEVLVQDGEPVEYGQRLMIIEPSND